MNLSVELAPRHHRGLRLANPVMTASGTFGYGVEYSQFIDIEELGAIVCKGTTLQPRPGNPQPRLFETASGLLNSIGLENMGIQALIKKMAPIWATWKVPVIVNIAGEKPSDYVKMAALLEGVDGVAGIEVNISCPNVGAGGVEFGANPKIARHLTSRIKEATSLPVIVKLTPNVTDIAEVAEAVAEAGADALCLVNTLKGMAIDVHNRRPFLGGVTGGLSGPAIKPVALYMVYRVAQKVGIPLIGCGGITTAHDALEFIIAGASAVQVGTAGLVNPDTSLEVMRGIQRFMQEQGVEELVELVGAAKRVCQHPRLQPGA